MLKTTLYQRVFAATVFCILGFFTPTAQAAQFKVLVVMSYHESFFWCQEIRQGIDSILADKCDISYTYLDTAQNPKGGEEKAKEVYDLYQKLQPDGVIVADDDAQRLFVLPYLKDKVKTPVIFCGVNEPPQKYGYPTSHITGVLERVHFKESIAFLQEIVSSVNTIGYLMRDNSTGLAFSQQAKEEANIYPAKFAGFELAKTFEEAISATETFKKSCDALFIEFIEGLPDKDGKPLPQKVTIPNLAKTFGKPTFAANFKTVKECGILCAVVKTGQEQGELAAKMLTDVFKGKPVSQIPISKNVKGKRVINITTMKALGIKPQPIVLQGTELVKTEE